MKETGLVEITEPEEKTGRGGERRRGVEEKSADEHFGDHNTRYVL